MRRDDESQARQLQTFRANKKMRLLYSNSATPEVQPKWGRMSLQQSNIMKHTLLRTLCFAGITLTAACGGLPAGQVRTPTPTQVNVSTPFNLPSPATAAADSTQTSTPGAGTGRKSTPLPTHLPAYSKTLFFTQSAPATRLPGECDQAGPGNPIDVTIPDYTEVAPGTSFTKTWRLVNTGPCTWSNDYSAVWFSGETFGALQQVAFPGKRCSWRGRGHFGGYGCP